MARWSGRGGWALGWRSKGRQERVQQYEERRKAAIDATLPPAREGLSKLIAGVKAARERTAAMQQEGLRGLARGFAPVSVPATESQLGAFQGRTPQDVRTEAGGRVAQRYFGPEAVAQRTATLEHLRQRRREAGLFDPLSAPLEALRPVTEPVGRFVGRNIVPNLPVVGPLAALIPERQRERIGEATAPYVLDPMNLVPGLGFTKFPTGARAGEGISEIARPGVVSRIGAFLRSGAATTGVAEREASPAAAILERVQSERAAPEAVLARVQEAREAPAATLARVQEARGTAEPASELRVGAAAPPPEARPPQMGEQPPPQFGTTQREQGLMPLSEAEQELKRLGVPPMAGGNPIERLTELIRTAKPYRAETEVLKRGELRRRAGALAGTFEAAQGREGLAKGLGQLKGELPKASFTPPESLLHPSEIDDLFRDIWRSDLRPFAKLNTASALEKLMLGQIPTRGEIKLLETQFGKELASAILSKRSLGTRAWENFMDAANLPRALMAAFDASAPLRQGIILTVSHPTQSIPAMGTMFKAMASEKAAQAVDDAIRLGPNADLKEAAGLYLAPWDSVASTLTSREENFMSALSERIPGIKQSQRGYVTYLNKLRSDIFDMVAANWEGTDKTVADWKSLGRFLNHASGRGDLGPLKEFGPMVNAVFFSPRLLLSRPQVALDAFTSTPAVRGLVVRDLLTSVGTGMTILAMMKYSGMADVQVDPRSTDFGKLRFGNQRIDFWGGFQPIARYTAQLLTGQRKTGAGDIVGTARGDVVARFLRSKLAPVPGLAESIRTGKTMIGQEVGLTEGTLKSQVYNNLVPLFVQDLIDAAKQQGMIGLARAVPAGLGVGVQTYQTREDIAKARFEKAGIPFNKDTWRDIAAKRPELQDLLGPPSANKQRLAQISEQQARDTFDQRLLNAVRQGDSDAGSAFRHRYADFQKQRVGNADAVYYGSNFPEPSTPEGQIRQQLYDLRPEDYPSATNAFEPDWDAYEDAKQALVAQMPQAWQDAYNQRTLYLPADMQDVERQYRQAQHERDQLADMSPVNGLSADQYREVKDFLAKVSDFTERLRVERQIADSDPQQVIAYVARHYGRTDPNFLDWVDYVRRGIKDEDRNREYDRFLLGHQSSLGLFYPELYRRKALQLGRQSGEPVYETPAGSYGSYGSYGDYGSYGSYGR